MRRALAISLPVALLLLAAAIAAVRMHRTLGIPEAAADVEGSTLPLAPDEIAAALDAEEQDPRHLAQQHPLLAALAANEPPPADLSADGLVAILEHAAPEPVMVELMDTLREPRAAIGALLTPVWLAEVVSRCPEVPNEFAGLCRADDRQLAVVRVEEELSRMLGARWTQVAIGATEAACAMGESGARVGRAAVAGEPAGENPRQQAAMGRVVLDCTTSRDDAIRELVRTLDADERDAWAASLELGRLDGDEAVEAMRRFEEAHPEAAVGALTGYFRGQIEGWDAPGAE